MTWQELLNHDEPHRFMIDEGVSWQDVIHKKSKARRKAGSKRAKKKLRRKRKKKKTYTGDNFAREKKEGLHGWFGRKGGGWVSCQSCEDDKKGTKPCGRQDASKGTKQRCRPTCAACKTYKRRKGKS